MLSLMYGFPFEDICMRVNIHALYTIVLQFDLALLSCGLEFITLSHRTVHEVIMLSQ